MKTIKRRKTNSPRKAYRHISLDSDFEYKHRTTISVHYSVSLHDHVVPARQRWQDSSDVGHGEGLPGDSGAPHSWPGRRHLAHSLVSGWGLRCKLHNIRPKHFSL